MIGRLTGTIIDDQANGAFVIDVAGVGYEVSAPLGTASKLKALANSNGAVKVYVHTHVRAEAFDLYSSIEFTNGIEHATRLDEGGWELETQGGERRRFDLLVVANGHHWDPRWPDFQGEFDGIEMHAHHYIDPGTPHDFTGKRILVVGLGNSAADIAVELSSKALDNKLTLSTRSGA